MAFGARRITEAARRWPLTVGATTWFPRPLSVVCVLRVEAALADPSPAVRFVGELDALRAAFPDRVSPWARWRGRDPIAAILRLDVPTRARVLRALLVGPPPKAPPPSDDPLEAVAAQQRALMAQRDAAGPTLAVMTMTLRCALGEAWYYAPGRYDTVDGYVPARQVLVDYEGWHAVRAQRMADDATAARVAQADDKHWRPIERAWRRQAMPQEG